METILFFIKRKKLLKDGSASIFVRVTFGRLSAEVATGKYYSIDGRALSDPPSKGLYIVRCVNNDGSVTALKKYNQKSDK